MPLIETWVNSAPAQRHLATLTALADDRNAGNALNGFCQVHVRHLADVLGHDAVSRVDRIALQLHGLLEAGTEAGDGDLIGEKDRPILRGLGLFVGLLLFRVRRLCFLFLRVGRLRAGHQGKCHAHGQARQKARQVG